MKLLTRYNIPQARFKRSNSQVATLIVQLDSIKLKIEESKEVLALAMVGKESC